MDLMCCTLLGWFVIHNSFDLAGSACLGGTRLVHVVSEYLYTYPVRYRSRRLADRLACFHRLMSKEGYLSVL